MATLVMKGLCLKAEISAEPARDGTQRVFVEIRDMETQTTINLVSPVSIKQEFMFVPVQWTITGLRMLSGYKREGGGRWSMVTCEDIKLQAIK